MHNPALSPARWCQQDATGPNGCGKLVARSYAEPSRCAKAHSCVTASSTSVIEPAVTRSAVGAPAASVHAFEVGVISGLDLCIGGLARFRFRRRIRLGEQQSQRLLGTQVRALDDLFGLRFRVGAGAAMAVERAVVSWVLFQRMAPGRSAGW